MHFELVGNGVSRYQKLVNSQSYEAFCVIVLEIVREFRTFETKRRKPYLDQ